MDAASLLAFVRFHAWANDRILTTAADLSDEELRRDGVLDHGSLDEDVRLRRYVEALDDAALNEPLRIGQSPDGVVPRWLIVATS